MLTLPTAVPLALVGLLLLDAVMGFLKWRGLRVTRLRPGLVLAGAGIGLLVLGVVRELSPPGLLVGAALAPPLYLAVALIANRRLMPEAWSTAGSWERHRASTVEIPLEDGGVPALLFEPLAEQLGAIAVLHGAGAHKTFYAWPLIDTLLEAGFAVCAIDLDGHGDSRRILDFPAVLDDAVVAVAWLRERWSFVGLIGISLGGCVAARAVAEGLRVDALAIFEAPITVEVTRRVRRHEYWTLARRGTWALHRYAGTLPLQRAWATAPARTRIGTVALIERLDLPGSLRKILAPLWLCYGSSDWIVPMWQVRAIGEAAPPGTPLVVIRRATHLSLPLDRRALRALSDWLCGVTRKQAPDTEERELISSDRAGR